MSRGLTTLVLIIGDRARLAGEALALLDAVRYFADRDGAEVCVAIDGPQWRDSIPAEKLAGWQVSVRDEECHLPGVLIEEALAQTNNEFACFLWPGVEVSTLFANREELLAEARRNGADLVCGHRGSGEQRQHDSQSHLVHPDDGFPPGAQHAWLQMLDLLPMANCVLKRETWRRLGGFSRDPALQRLFWWEFTQRLTAHGKLASLPLQPVPSSGWHGYAFGRPRGARPDTVVRRAMWAQSDRDRVLPLQEGEPAAVQIENREADPLWQALPRELRERVETQAQGRPLKVLVLGGINEPAHNQLCFFNYFERMRAWGFVEWRSQLDTLAQPGDVAFCDLVIFSRVRSPQGARLMDFCREQGVATLYMLDDNWFWLGREWAEYADLFSPGRPDYENFLHCLRGADAALTYNAALAADLAPHARRLIQIPTNVDLSCFPVEPRNDDVPVTIGYVGSLRKNLAPFQALVEIVRARSDVRLMVMSNALPEEFQALPAGRVTFHPYQFHYAGYAATVCRERPDVLVAPIGDTRFEASKCPNKFLEISASGAAGVYSRAEPYLSAVREGETGLFAGESPAEWRAQIERLIGDTSLRRNIAARALETVRREYDTAAVLPRFATVLLDCARRTPSARAGAWIATAPSLAMQRWAAVMREREVRPVFIELLRPGQSAQDVQGAQGAEGMMSFSVPGEVEALTDLLRSLPLGGVVIGGLERADIGLAAARRAPLPALVTGVSPAEEATFAQLLPGQYLERRRKYLVLPIAGQDQLAQEAAARAAVQAKLRARLQDRRDAWRSVTGAFPGWAQDVRLSTKHYEGFLLQPSGDLAGVAVHVYWLHFAESARINGLTLFPLQEFSDATGVLEVEWGTPGRGYHRAQVALSRLGPLGEAHFDLPGDEIAAGEARELRLRVLGARRPLRILELRRFRWLGARVELHPFCHLRVASP